jgi:uncharacterized protein YijF (DUF1287 family)
MTPHKGVGSRFLLALSCVMFAGCSRTTDAQPIPPAPAAAAKPGHAAPEACLGLSDKGIWSDLDAQVQLPLPEPLAPERVSLRIDRDRGVAVLSIDGFPRKAYPLGGAATLRLGELELALRPGDRDELRAVISPSHTSEGKAAHDRDGDGIPDPLDVLIGAKKEVLNAESYTEEAEDYISMKYPGGDVPRTIGVCTDVIVRAVRNAGIDLQKELHEDVRRAKAAYPMVKGAGDPSIDQRRVGTLLPYFKRHWEQHTAKLDDPADPLRPGDVIFMDTFPSRPGPDHIGILSDRLDAQTPALPLVINNWTDGTKTAEMDLLTFVPVLYRFRLPP